MKTITLDTVQVEWLIDMMEIARRTAKREYGPLTLAGYEKLQREILEQLK